MTPGPLNLGALAFFNTKLKTPFLVIIIIAVTVTEGKLFISRHIFFYVISPSHHVTFSTRE